MGIYDQPIDLKPEVEYFFEKGYKKNYELDEILQEIREEDFRKVFLSDNAKLLIFCISKDFAEKAFHRANHLGLLHETLYTDASRVSFRGTVLDYLNYRKNESDTHSPKYTDILDQIQEMQGDGPAALDQQSQTLAAAGSSASPEAEAEPTPATPILSPQSGQDQPHGGGSMLTYSSLNDNQRALYDNLKSAIEHGSDVTSVFQGQGTEDIQAVLGSRVLLVDDTSTTFLMFALEQKKKNIAEYIVENADKDVIKMFLTEESIMKYHDHPPKSHTALSYVREQNDKFEEKFVEMIENKMKEAGLEVPAQHSQPPVGAGSPTSQGVSKTPGTPPLSPQGGHQPSRPMVAGGGVSEAGATPDTPPLSPQSGQDQSHGGGNMTEQLTPEQQELYDSLEGAIKNGTGVDEILRQVMVDLSPIFNINKGQKLYDLLDYTTDKGRAVAGAIWNKFRQVNLEGSFTSHLRDKIYDAAITDNNAVAEGILQFARTHSIFHGRFFDKLRSELESAVLNDSKENANKIFNLAKNNSEQKDFLSILNKILYKSIEDNKNDDLVKILNFASTHNVLEDLLNHRYTEGTALEFARKQNNEEVAKVIKERMDSPGIKVDQYKHSSAQANNNGKTTTFLDKLSEHKGKIAVVSIVSAIAAILFTPWLAVVAAVAAIVAVGILAKKVHAEYKGQDVNDKSVPKAIESVLSDMLPGSIEPHKAPQPGVVN